MTQAILHWLAPPELPSAGLRRHARALWLATWPFFVVITLVLGIAVLVEPDTLIRRATTVAAVGVLIATLHLISRRGRPRLASWLLVIGLSVIVTQRAWITGGVHAPVAVFYALFVIMGGALLGARGGFVTAAVCVVGAIALTTGETLGFLTPPPGAPAPLAQLVFIFLAVGIALVLQALVTYRARREGLTVDAVELFVHDMRSPLQVVLAHLHLLRMDARDEDAPNVDGAIQGATTLHRMTNSLLDISRLDADSMPVKSAPTDLSALTSAVVRSIRILQPDRTITVESNANADCRCDPELMRRVIENLVMNAMKHTPSDGRVRVVISGNAERAHVEVHDEGAGVPMDKRAKLFEPFSADGLRSMSGYESSGLGLTFCRLAVEAQGGSIRIEDNIPTGSVFIVELPR